MRTLLSITVAILSILGTDYASALWAPRTIAGSGNLTPIVLTRSIKDLRALSNTVPSDTNKNLAYVWLATAGFLFLLEMLAGRLYAFSGCMAALVLVIYVCLSGEPRISLVQIGIWTTTALALRWIIPSWIRTHNDELRDRRRVAREAREAQARADALSATHKQRKQDTSSAG